MKKISNKLIKYLSGEMLPGEIKEFERELEHSPEMQKQKLNYETLIGKLNSSSDIKTNKDYFVNLIPVFRSRIEVKQRKAKSVKWTLSLSSGAAVIVLFLFLFIPQSQSDINNIGDVVSQMDNKELTALITDLDIDISKHAGNEIESINDIYFEELSSVSESAVVNEIFEGTEYYSSLTEEESEIIYQELVNKKILEN